MNEYILSTKEAFKTMFLFLEYFLNKNNYDELRPLLGDLSFLQDEGTADPAAWEEWTEIIDNISTLKSNHMLTPEEAFIGTKLFLEKYYQETTCIDTAAVLAHMYLPLDKTTINPDTWKIWLECVADVKAGKGDFYLRLG